MSADQDCRRALEDAMRLMSSARTEIAQAIVDNIRTRREAAEEMRNAAMHEDAERDERYRRTLALLHRDEMEFQEEDAD